jgi:hypothetical protein
MAEYFREGRSKFQGGSSTNYRALGKDNPEEGTTPYASLSVIHDYAVDLPTFTQDNIGSLEDEEASSGLHPTYLNKKHAEVWDDIRAGNRTEAHQDAMDAFHVLRGHTIKAGRNSDHPDPKAWAVEQTRTNPLIAPDKLFFEHTPAKTHIGALYSDPSMKVSAMNLLGVAYDEHNNAPFESDSSLTRFSSRLTQNALKRGLPVTTDRSNPNAISTADDANDSTHDNHRMVTDYANKVRSSEYPFSYATPISDLGVIRGKESVREILGKKRNTKPVTSKGLSDQFLPGMEGFV